MNALHLHLIVAHVPVVMAPVGLAMLVIATVRRSQELQCAALVLLIACAACAGLTFLSGDCARNLAKRLPSLGIMARDVEQHEEAAETALALMLLMGSLAASSLVAVRASRRVFAVCVGLVIAVALAASLLTLHAASLGGQIRHSEMRPDRSFSNACWSAEE